MRRVKHVKFQYLHNINTSKKMRERGSMLKKKAERVSKIVDSRERIGLNLSSLSRQFNNRWLLSKIRSGARPGPLSLHSNKKAN